MPAPRSGKRWVSVPPQVWVEDVAVMLYLINFACCDYGGAKSIGIKHGPTKIGIICDVIDIRKLTIWFTFDLHE